VVTLLADAGIANIEDLRVAGSPQNLAAIWIADQDKVVLPLSLNNSFLDRYVLSVLYFALGGKKAWPTSLHFLSDKHVCDWWQFVEGSPDPAKGQKLPITGVFGCIDVKGELVPTGISLRKYYTLLPVDSRECQLIDRLPL
jgi:hypothetical protein